MSVRPVVVLLAALFLLSGCGAVVTGPYTATDAVTDGTTTPRGDVGTAVQTGSLVPDATGIEATVVDVVDGDTLDVRYRNGTTDTVRLLGMDTPEVHGATDPAEFEGVPDTDAGRRCLESSGETASAVVRARLAGAEVRLFVDPGSDRRDRYDRLLAYVVHDDRNVNYWLVARGHARVYDTDFRYAEAFYAAEDTARERGLGVWACADSTGDGSPGAVAESSLALAEIHADASGNDHENLLDEYVVFRNAGEQPLDLSGWTVTDAADHAYTFPDGSVLSAGGNLTLHTGTGADGDGHYYWASDTAVWNNGGDTITVYDAGERRVLSRSY